MKHCKYCKRPRRLHARGLCWTCYRNLGVRALYPVAKGYERRHTKSLPARKATLVAQRERERKLERPERQEGEPPGRCFWCQRFRCDGKAYFQVCAECQQGYAERAATMPPGEAMDGWSTSEFRFLPAERVKARRCGQCGRPLDGVSSVNCKRCRKRRSDMERARRQRLATGIKDRAAGL